MSRDISPESNQHIPLHESDYIDVNEDAKRRDKEDAAYYHALAIKRGWIKDDKKTTLKD